MYNGTYHNKQHAVQAVSDTSLVEVGHLVTVDCENCDKEPLLGKVLKVVDEEVEIVWLWQILEGCKAERPEKQEKNG